MKCEKLPENFVVIDVETTGLDHAAGSILEIGAVDGTGRSFYRRVAMERGRVAMERGRVVEAGALRCNGIDALDLGLGVSVASAMCDLWHWLGGGVKRWIMGGKNPQFDYAWLAANWPQGDIGVGIGAVISRRCIDLHSLAYGYAMGQGMDMTVPGFSTDVIYSQLGMDPEPAPHNALRGALHELEGFRRLLVADVEHDCDPVFEACMESMDRGEVQRVCAPHIDNGSPARGFMESAMGAAQNVEAAK
jgi:DNA polymerase III epsilon subunit-like protein